MPISYKQLQRATVRQHDQADCGVACLQSILQYWGKTISMEQLRDWSGTNASGTTMLGLKQAAIQAGLLVEGYEADLDSLKTCEDICILHVVVNNSFYHYLVYWGYDEALQRYIISDPGKGLVEEYTAGELDEVWQSKTLLLFKPATEIPATENIRPASQWSWMWSFLQEDLNLLGMAVVIGVAIAILGISTAVFSQQLIDHILPNKDHLRLFSGIGLLLMLLLARGALGYVRQLFLLRQARDFNLRIVHYFFESLLHLPKTFFDNRRTGDLVARMHDTSRIQRTVS
jgi:ATP-binding cassette, subfamily C, bacteriocin exporter